MYFLIVNLNVGAIRSIQYSQGNVLNTYTVHDPPGLHSTEAGSSRNRTIWKIGNMNSETNWRNKNYKF